MFQNFQSGFPFVFPRLEMSDRDGARDVVRDEVRPQEGAQTVPGWSNAPEDPVGQIDERGPEIWKWPGVWSLEPGARCQLLPGYRWGLGNYWVGSSPGLQRACVFVCVSVSECECQRDGHGDGSSDGSPALGVRVALVRFNWQQYDRCSRMELGSRSSHGWLGAGRGGRRGQWQQEKSPQEGPDRERVG